MRLSVSLHCRVPGIPADAEGAVAGGLENAEPVELAQPAGCVAADQQGLIDWCRDRGRVRGLAASRRGSAPSCARWRRWRACFPAAPRRCGRSPRTGSCGCVRHRARPRRARHADAVILSGLRCAGAFRRSHCCPGTGRLRPRRHGRSRTRPCPGRSRRAWMPPPADRSLGSFAGGPASPRGLPAIPAWRSRPR